MRSSCTRPPSTPTASAASARCACTHTNPVMPGFYFLFSASSLLARIGDSSSPVRFFEKRCARRMISGFGGEGMGGLASERSDAHHSLLHVYLVRCFTLQLWYIVAPTRNDRRTFHHRTATFNFRCFSTVAGCFHFFSLLYIFYEHNEIFFVVFFGFRFFFPPPSPSR